MEGTCNRCAFPVQDPMSAKYFTVARPLMHAAWKGYLQCVKELIDAGADVNQKDDDNLDATPLIVPASGGYLQIVQELIAAGADVNQKECGYRGATPLTKSAFDGYLQIVQELIAAGADVNLADIDGETPLMRAARGGQLECLLELIKSGADVNLVNNECTAGKTNKFIRNRQTALMLAALYGRKQCLIELIAAGGDVSMVDLTDANAFHYAAQEGKYDCLRELLTVSDVNHTDSTGRTALFLVCERGSPKCVDLLLKAGADVNIISSHQTTALMNAAEWDHPECFQLLIEAGADVNFRGSTYSALNRAAFYANNRYVEKLLSAGAIVNVEGLPPVLVDALCNSTAQCKRAFEEARLNYIPENHSHVTCVNLLIEAGADVNMKGEKGRTALMNAAKNDHVYCIDLLIQAGADLNQPSNDGSTPLTSAAFFGATKSLEKLLSAGANVNASSSGVSTALVASVWNSQRDWFLQGGERSRFQRNCKQKECTQMLIESGADVNAQTKSGDSALMKASANGYKECVSLLLEAGADVNAVNKTGNIALTLAAVAGNVSIAKRLLKANCQINKLPGMIQNALTSYREHGDTVDADISRLLFAAGEILDEELNEMLQDDLHLKDEKMQLKHIYREAIRKHLLDLDPHQHLFGRIPLLGLPEIIKKYLLYDEILEEKVMGQQGDP